RISSGQIIFGCRNVFLFRETAGDVKRRNAFWFGDYFYARNGARFQSMMIFGFMAGYFTLFVGGIGVVLLIMRGSQRLNVIECACLAWLFGVGIVSLLLWLGGMFASGIVLQCLVTVACLALGILGWRVRQKSGLHFSLPRPTNSIEWV